MLFLNIFCKNKNITIFHKKKTKMNFEIDLNDFEFLDLLGTGAFGKVYFKLFPEKFFILGKPCKGLKNKLILRNKII